MPKRLRYHLERDPAVQNVALYIFISAIERVMRQCSPDAGAASRLGAVVFIHRFGALFNPHLHCHCIVVDGVFDAAAEGSAVFHPAGGLDATTIGEVQTAVRRRLLRAVERRGLLSPEEARIMAAWEHGGGFSVDAGVRIEADDRNGLERLLRYCAATGIATSGCGRRSPRWRVQPVKPPWLRAMRPRTPGRLRRTKRRQTSRRIAKRWLLDGWRV